MSDLMVVNSYEDYMKEVDRFVKTNYGEGLAMFNMVNAKFYMELLRKDPLETHPCFPLLYKAYDDKYGKTPKNQA